MNKLFNFFVILISLVLIIAYFVGEVHAFKKHSVADGIIGAVIFPWGIYRGFESRFHKEEINILSVEISFEKESKICANFFAALIEENVDKEIVYTNLGKYSLRFNNFPIEYQNKLQELTDVFIEYSLSTTDEVLNAISKYKTSGEFVFIKNDRTIELENILQQNNFVEEVNKSKEGEIYFKNLFNDVMTSNNNSINDNTLNEIEFQFKKNQEKTINEFKKMYLLLFKMELKY